MIQYSKYSFLYSFYNNPMHSEHELEARASEGDFAQHPVIIRNND